MKKLKRIISGILLLCMILTCMPPVQIVSAAPQYQYVLDTDGIDVGAQYLIVSGTGATEDALTMNSSITWRASVTQVNVVGGNSIASFNNESNCLWTFSSSSNGTVSSNGYYLNIDQYVHYQAQSATMQFANFGGGRYGIYLYGGAYTNLQYLCHNPSGDENNRYMTQYVWGVSGTNPNAYASFAYLYKRVEADTGYTVEFLGNGNTAGQLPATVEAKEGETLTIPAPSDDFRKDVGNDTYLFWCWTENQDGTGTEYRPGDKVTVTGNMTFYAQWYLQTKYAVTVITDLDGVPTDLHKIMGEEVSVYIRMGDDESTQQKLERTADGTYVAYVTENGTYSVYTQHGDGPLEEAHGHKVVIYNQSGHTELLNYSVSYDLNGGTLANAPATKNYHANTPITATTEIPTLKGNRFVGWKDQNGKVIAPGGVVTDALREKTVLTAQWEDLVDVTVNVTVNHVPEGGEDISEGKADVEFLLLQMVNGAYQPYGELHKLTGGEEVDGKTTYTVQYTDLPRGDYNISTSKSMYEETITKTTDSNGDQVINVVYQYVPQSFDMHFDVHVNMGELPGQLRPSAVNVRVTCWNIRTNSWDTITQHQTGAPVTVLIDENGNGSGFFTVWKEWSDGEGAYYYRVRVSSFVMPDGTVVQAQEDQANVSYSPVGSGLYTATADVQNGVAPENSTLPGSYFDGTAQAGRPVVDVAVTPFTVTFETGEGKLNGQTSVVLANQYKYPDLSQYVPVPNEYDGKFSGWYVDGVKAENLAGQYLEGNITYVAQYNPHMTITGTVYAENSYEQDGQTVEIWDSDRIKQVRVVLQKNINGVYNDVDSLLVDIAYDEGTHGTGSYTFDHLVDDGTAYRIYAVLHNYDVTYDNNADTVFGDEYTVIFDNSHAQVDLHLDLAPELYDQTAIVDAGQIGKDFRPTDVKVQILYRDLGDTLSYKIISQHTTGEEGLKIPLNGAGNGTGVESVWNWHNDGALYEYQVAVDTLYGQVKGVFTSEGVPFTENMPFTVKYDMPSYYVDPAAGTAAPLKATLIPKEYKITFDLNLGTNSNATVLGMEKFLVDNGDSDRYAYVHTWSYAKDFEAFPYREGYVFAGWKSDHDGVVVTNSGNVHVGAELAEEITLTAQWIPLKETDYTIRHLELNTDKVLSGAQAVSGTRLGTNIKAVNVVKAIEGYTYVGAMVNGTYYDKNMDPGLIISNSPSKNMMVIYYLPDGSDGYTEQVESNLYLNKTATLEDDGTYTITMETYAKDNPITTYIQQNTPMDIVLVMDQSGSIIQSGYLDELQMAVNNFVGQVAEHGRHNEVDHRIAIVGYAGNEDEPPTSTDTSSHPIAGGNTSEWVNTGVFDSNGDFHPYPVTGFNYTKYTGPIDTNGTYYTYADGEYLLLTYHENYRHLITENDARIAVLNGETVYGYTEDQFVELTRNASGLWIYEDMYGDKYLYSLTEFFTFHHNVWTHRKGVEYRQIHGYMENGVLVSADGHEGLYTRTETRNQNPQLNVYKDALIPVSVGANGSGGVNPGLTKSTSHLGSNGGTFVQYGVEMANRVFAANPLDPEEGRIRVMVMFTDGMPGIGTFDENVANEAIAQAYITKNDHDAYVYTVGLYPSNGVSETSDEGFFMNAVSSNYPDAKKLNDVRSTESYVTAADGTTLDVGGPYYVKAGNNYYELTLQVRYVLMRGYEYSWGYTGSSGRVNIVTNYNSNPTQVVRQGMVNGNVIYKKTSAGYKETPYSGYYSTTDSGDDLQRYFNHILQEITTKITTEIILNNDTILRDIMGQGLVLTPGSTVTAYKQNGTYDPETETITWTGVNEPVAQVTIPENPADTVSSPEKTPEGLNFINVYNLNADNATNPNDSDTAYHPHTVDVTGYDFVSGYLGDGNTKGWKMVVTITGVEARDDVVWGRATDTNYSTSGLWLPADKNGKRELLLAFDQPSTIFVERAYVLDYGKEFKLQEWYFDDDTTYMQDAEAIHVDCCIEDGMNGFDVNAPVKANGDNGNTEYGNVRIDENGDVYYQPTTTQWGGYDQFYIFGNTWRRTVQAQDANQNGNLWNKVTVIPANNIYYEDSFVTGESGGVNGISGFRYSGDWEVVETGSGGNVEHPEQVEDENFGGVHGWIDGLVDDSTFTDGSAHGAGLPPEDPNKEPTDARVEFTFTGTGVDVYTRTNAKSGMLIAQLKGNSNAGNPVSKLFIIDNLSMSGEYYHIPTMSFKDLPYGTYTVTLIATKASAVATGQARYEYYLDGIRIYNPLGNVLNNADDIVKEGYGKEMNPVFTEIRDIILTYGDFTAGMATKGAAFIDWIQEGQGSGNDGTGTSQSTYEVGTTFKTYGPKNEIYLAKGQAVVLKVDPKNTYYVGMKSLISGKTATVNVSGLSTASPKVIPIAHTADMYYAVTPMDGYIVIQNDAESEGLLALTKLRTTNMYAASAENGVQPVEAETAVAMMYTFAQRLEAAKNPPPPPEPDEPVIPPVQPEIPPDPTVADKIMEEQKRLAQQLFDAIRTWLLHEKGGTE